MIAVKHLRSHPTPLVPPAFDKFIRLPLLAGVSFLRRITVCLVLAIWMAATQHCTLEAAGMLSADSAHEDVGCCDSQGSCSKDSCHIVERGASTLTASAIKAPAPDLHSCLCSLCSALLVPAVDPVLPDLSSLSQDTLAWVPIWHFERRAAPSPRAPSCVIA